MDGNQVAVTIILAESEMHVNSSTVKTALRVFEIVRSVEVKRLIMFFD